MTISFLSKLKTITTKSQTKTAMATTKTNSKPKADDHGLWIPVLTVALYMCENLGQKPLE